ncbi:hypothetical protein [Shinella sp.]|uniref:hypothetical protein n=1 Tax=Shinella sp. TaxID=1870904 RepID=UPI00301D9A6B
MINLTRRQSLGFLAAVGTVSAGTVAVSAVTTTAQERFDHHLAELKKAAEELDPMIGSWQVMPIDHDGKHCAVVITAFRISGRYEGDGVYEGGEEQWNGNRIKWRVSLLPDRQDGERLFMVTTLSGVDRLQLLESRLETFIGRRLA